MNKEIEKYVQDNIAKGKQYADDIMTGKIKSNKWIKLAVQRYYDDLDNDKYVTKWNEVERFFKFSYLINIKHQNKYKRFNPFPFQCFIIINLQLFHLKSNPEKKRYRYFFLFMARKNGKSVFASVLSLYKLVGDRELDPTSLVVASTREQASILLDYGKNIVSNSPIIQSKLEIRQYSIKYQSGNSSGIFKVLPNNSSRLDGYNPNCSILDEIHSYTDDSLYRVTKSAILARQNPLTILISTAGFNNESFCAEMLEMGKNILAGDLQDDSFLFMLFTLDDDDNFKDPKNWIKSNPSLGEILSLDDMMIEFNQAKNLKSLMNNFLTKNLNVFTGSIDDWIEDKYLNEAFKHQHSIEDYQSEPCWVGIDLSSTRDLTSVVYLFYNSDEDRYIAFPYFYMADNEKLIRQGGIDLQKWIDNGLIIKCKSKTIDYEQIYNDIIKMSELVDIQVINYDKFNSALLISKLEDQGIHCESFNQTAMKFNFPLKLIEKYIYEKKIDLNSDVLKWNFRNVVLYQDGNGNIKVIKNKAKDAVDGVVSLSMAMGGWIAQNIDDELKGLTDYINN
ncbi:MAG: terminase large subunit [bacterium]